MAPRLGHRRDNIVNRLDAGPRKSAWPLVGLSLGYTFVGVNPIVANPAPPGVVTLRHEYVIWGIFILDDARQLHLTQDQTHFS